MPNAPRNGTLHAADRPTGGVSFGLNRPASTTLAGRRYRYAGPYNPYSLAERIYANDQAFLDRLKSEGFTIHVEAV